MDNCCSLIFIAIFNSLESTKLNSALYKGSNINLHFIPVAVKKLPVQRCDYSSVVHFIFCHSVLQNRGAYNLRKESAAAFVDLVNDSNSWKNSL